MTYNMEWHKKGSWDNHISSSGNVNRNTDRNEALAAGADKGYDLERTRDNHDKQAEVVRIQNL